MKNNGVWILSLFFFFVSLPPYCILFARLYCVDVAMRSFCFEHWAYVYV